VGECACNCNDDGSFVCFVLRAKSRSVRACRHGDDNGAAARGTRHAARARGKKGQGSGILVKCCFVVVLLCSIGLDFVFLDVLIEVLQRELTLSEGCERATRSVVSR